MASVKTEPETVETATQQPLDMILDGSEEFSTMLHGVSEGFGFFNVAYDKSSFKSNMFKAFEDLREEMFLSDIVLLIGPEKVPMEAHRFILASFSKYFKAMFTKGTKEAKQKQVQLPAFNADTFSVVLDFMYTGKAELDQENAHKVSILADHLESQDLADECGRFIMKYVKRENCVRVYQFADLYHLKKLKGDVKAFIVDGIDEISRSNLDFADLSTSLVLELVEDPAAVVWTGDAAKNEAQLFQMVWNTTTKLSERKRNSFIPKILRAIHLPVMKPEFLDYIEKKVRHIPEAMRLIKEARLAYMAEANYWYLPRYKESFTFHIEGNLTSETHNTKRVLIKGVPWYVSARKTADAELELLLHKPYLSRRKTIPFQLGVDIRSAGNVVTYRRIGRLANTFDEQKSITANINSTGRYEIPSIEYSRNALEISANVTITVTNKGLPGSV